MVGLLISSWRASHVFSQLLEVTRGMGGGKERQVYLFFLNKYSNEVPII